MHRNIIIIIIIIIIITITTQLHNIHSRAFLPGMVNCTLPSALRANALLKPSLQTPNSQSGVGQQHQTKELHKELTQDCSLVHPRLGSENIYAQN
jgi:hypothetical protein